MAPVDREGPVRQIHRFVLKAIQDGVQFGGGKGIVRKDCRMLNVKMLEYKMQSSGHDSFGWGGMYPVEPGSRGLLCFFSSFTDGTSLIC